MRLGNAIRAFSIAVALSGLLAAPALAAPSYEIELSNDANEVQKVTVNASGGQFRFTYGADTTGDLAFNTPASGGVGPTASIQNALNTLPSINSGGGSVTVAGGPGGADPYLVTFDGGPLATTDVAEMTASSGTTPLSGGAATATVATDQRGGVSRSDERVDYTVRLKNLTAAPTPLPHTAAVVGDVLTCAGAAPPKNWTPGTTRPVFGFEWRRNGAPIPGATSEKHTSTAADAGTVLQCLVTGTNDFAAARFASLPGIVVAPVPATEPPKSSNPTADNSRPAITGTTIRTCAAPTNWTAGGTPVAFSFQWLRNGEPILGATNSTYVPGVADMNTNLQCEVIGTNAGGSLVGISANSNPPANSPSQLVSHTPSVIVNATTVTVELPGGEETFVHSTASQGTPAPTPATGWVCSPQLPAGGQPAKALCTNYQLLGPGQSYPELVIAAGLGSDAPEVAIAKATVSGGGAPAPESAIDEFTFVPPIPFEIKAFETKLSDSAGIPYTQAGGHPFSVDTSFSFSTRRFVFGKKDYGAVEAARNIVVDAPRGFVGNALAIPKNAEGKLELCPSLAAVKALPTECPPASIVGGIKPALRNLGKSTSYLAVYAIEPEFGRPAQFAFAVAAANSNVYTFAPILRPEDGYAISFESAPVSQSPILEGADVRLCGFGAKSELRELLEGQIVTGCKAANEPDPDGAGPLTGANDIALITNPTRCTPPAPKATIKVDTWENPGAFKSKDSIDPLPTDCEEIPFEPEMALAPTSNQADSPTGMDVEITMPTDGVEKPSGISQANLKRVTVTLPEGMAVNPSAGHGLGACSAAQVGMDRVSGIPNGKEAQCPDSSKIGTIGITTPLIQETLTGDVFIAKQGKDNPFDSNIALYMVFSSKKDGVTIKVTGEVKPDPETGQMVVTFDENPEAPFSKVELHFPGGSRAPLLNPPRCGTYEIAAELTPWNAADPDNPTPAETVTKRSYFEVTEGPGGGSCPTGALQARLSAGPDSAVAGKQSPFRMRLTREDGSQRFTGLSLKTPLGLTAYLRGIPYCPDVVLSAIPEAEETGQAEIDHPSCPAASLIGTAKAGAGAGPSPFFVETGKAYLSGPYKGAPLSITVVTPAVAGPLDLGNVVIRNAVYVDPVTAEITVVSDPIPTILHGLLLDIRDIRVAIDRPGFTLNPTNCEEMSVRAKVSGERGRSTDISIPFSVGGCEKLGFKPRIALSLKGGTKRGDHPSLRAVVRPRPGDANISRAAVTLPRSAFLDQAHIRTICTRVQWAADACPKAAIYGQAEAISPLLDVPLKGPAYLRSSDNLLPDLVVDLRGPEHLPIKIEAAFRTDSIKGGIRSTLDIAPDAPVSRFVLRMQGGKKGLIVNSRNLCAGKNRADARLGAHNGRRYNFRPVVEAVSCKKQRKGAKGKGSNEAPERKRGDE